MPICPNCGSYVDEGSPMCSCGTSIGRSSYDDFEIDEEQNLKDLAKNCCRIARSHEKNGRYAEAIMEYENALHYDYNSFTLYEMGKDYMELGRYERALECFEDCSQSNNVIRSKGEALAGLERYDEAVKTILDLIDKIRERPLRLPKFDPDDAESVNYYNNVKYQKEIDKNKELARTYNSLGWIYNLKGDERTAIEYFEEGILYDYNYANNWNCKAIALDHLGEYVESLKFYDIAMSLDDDVVIKNNRKACLENYAKAYQSGNYDKESKYLDEALSLIDDDFDYVDLDY